MGEIAEGMVRGVLCEDCGGYVADDGMAYFRGADCLYKAPDIRGCGFPIYHPRCGPRANELSPCED